MGVDATSTPVPFAKKWELTKMSMIGRSMRRHTSSPTFACRMAGWRSQEKTRNVSCATLQTLMSDIFPCTVSMDVNIAARGTSR